MAALAAGAESRRTDSLLILFTRILLNEHADQILK